MGVKPILVHVTHEAASKIGGIGAVLEGLFTSQVYLQSIERSIIIGPLFTTEGSVLDRLGEQGEVLYSSFDGLVNTGYASAFRKIEGYFNVGIVYGRRMFVDKQTGVKSSPEVVLLDVKRAEPGIVNGFKSQLFERFGIRSDLYEHLWEYEEYVRLAPIALSVLKAIGAATDKTVIVAHEYMGMPTALAAMLDTQTAYRTAFYAHEVATMRNIVEHHPGHDTMFYNVIKRAHQKKLYVKDVFGDQSQYFKHPLVEASKHCDVILAVGRLVADELRFLAPEFESKDIAVVYNGIPAYQTTMQEKLASKEKLQHYCYNILGYKPDLTFSHVTRLVQSKGLWRDLRVLEHLDTALRRADKRAVMFLLSTEVGQRRSADIYDMEAKYNWPVAHREGWPDLSGGEAAFYTAVQEFNTKSSSVKVVFINQFGFDRKLCGVRMPANMEFIDIRRGTDVEFGQSVYEPFGIATLEPLTFGALCVFSSVSGCAGFVDEAIAALRVTSPDGIKNIVIADYTSVSGMFGDVQDLLRIDRNVRNRVETKVGREVADEIIRLLPKTEAEITAMVENGYRIAKNMSWDAVVDCYILPHLMKALKKERSANIRTAG
ncbi:MAG: glycosyltransferase [Sedimentisphaerales bacterium]|nr:glycosyltransferase [Sedimentisphaerales bacterium]